MNIERIKKKYPYKKTYATITKIISFRRDAGFVGDYDSNDAIEDLRRENYRFGGFDPYYSKYEVYNKISEHASSRFGYIEESYDGPVSKVYEQWYEYKLHIEYYDLNNQKINAVIEIQTENELTCGEQICICYMIDNPQKVTDKEFLVNTIEDYKRKRFYIGVWLGLALAVTVSFCIAINI